MRVASAARTLQSLRWWLAWPLLAAGAIAALAPRPAGAQDGELPPELLMSAVELEELVGPIALYPDDLVAIVLPAATYPLQIVQAARLLEERERNPSLAPDETWDDSVVALLNYPEVVELLNDDLDWTWQLGEAVLAQRADVLDAIQDFRDRAYLAGNLRSDERQVVTQDAGAIAIRPADPEVIYVPYYEPRRVIVRHAYPVFHYYPWSYPVYYYPYPVGYNFFGFRTGFFWGVTSAFAIGWQSHHVHVHHHFNRGHPYFGRRFYDPFYVRRGANVNINVVNNVWQPRYNVGARPVRNRVDGVRVTRSTEGRTYRTQSRTTEGRAPSYRSQSRSVEGRPLRSSASGTLRSPAQTAPRAAGTARSTESNAGASRTPGDRATTAPRAPGRTAPAERTYRSGSATAPRSTAGSSARIEGSARLGRVAPSQPRATPQQRSTSQQRLAPQQRSVPQQRSAPIARSAPSGSAPRMQSAPRAMTAPRGGSAPRATSAPRAASAPRSSAAPRATGGNRSGGSYRSGSGRSQQR